MFATMCDWGLMPPDTRCLSRILTPHNTWKKRQLNTRISSYGILASLWKSPPNTTWQANSQHRSFPRSNCGTRKDKHLRDRSASFLLLYLHYGNHMALYRHSIDFGYGCPPVLAWCLALQWLSRDCSKLNAADINQLGIVNHISQLQYLVLHISAYTNIFGIAIEAVVRLKEFVSSSLWSFESESIIPELRYAVVPYS